MKWARWDAYACTKRACWQRQAVPSVKRSSPRREALPVGSGPPAPVIHHIVRNGCAQAGVVIHVEPAGASRTVGGPRLASIKS